MGGWLSGSCADDEPGVFVVFENRPEQRSGPDVEASEDGHVIWMDTGSGPGYEAHSGDERSVDQGE